VARFWSSSRSSAALLLAAASLTACGNGPWHPKVEGPFGQGRKQVWVIRAHEEPKAVVVLLHGLSRDTGEQFIAWQKHLAEEGYDVVFPRYDVPYPSPDARDGVVAGVREGLARLKKPKVPLILVGHSRGGRLAVEAAAYLHPRAVVAVFPGLLNAAFEEPTNLALIPPTTHIWLLVGDHDTDVGNAGALELYQRLRAADVADLQITGGIIRSFPGFSANHESVYRTDLAARKAIWGRVDRILASVR
jgi:pimeloyl-ACP methyl ester carboxylesterase